MIWLCIPVHTGDGVGCLHLLCFMPLCIRFILAARVSAIAWSSEDTGQKTMCQWYWTLVNTCDIYFLLWAWHCVEFSVGCGGLICDSESQPFSTLLSTCCVLASWCSKAGGKVLNWNCTRWAWTGPWGGNTLAAVSLRGDSTGPAPGKLVVCHPIESES